MSLPLKIAVGTLGGGSVAVGGCGVYSTVTGKPVLFFKGTEGQSNSAVSGDSDQSSSSEGDQVQNPTKVKELLDLIGSLTTNCEIKIWKDNSRAEVDKNIGEENATTLLTKINEIKGDQCKGTSKSLVFKQNTDTGKTWEVINETDQVKELVASDAFKCTVKIKTADNTEYKDVSSSDFAETLDGLYEKIKAISECLNDGVLNKEIVFQKQSDPSGWNQVETKKQIEDLVGNTSSFKCEVKIRTSSNTDPVPWISANLEANDLEKLLKKLKSINESKCGSTVSETPKPTLILHKDSENSQTVFLTEKEWVDAWIKKTDGFKDENKKCVLKIFVSGSPKSIEETDDLTGLHSFLSKTTVTEACTSSGSQESSKDVVVQKEGNQWSLYPTLKQQIEKLKTQFSEKCALKIHGSNNQDKTLNDIQNETSLKNLLDKLKSVYDANCKNGASSDKKTITITESSDNSWQEKVENTPSAG